jgi:hypothetical protein
MNATEMPRNELGQLDVRVERRIPNPIAERNGDHIKTRGTQMREFLSGAT